MDRIIDPDGGINRYPDLRSALTKSIYLEMTDPEVRVLRNLRRMNFAQLEHFDPKDPGKIIMAENDPTEGSFVADELLEGDRYKPRARKRYHYNIGKYEESTYYCQFLSDKLIRLPSGRSATVREMTEQLSLKPHSMFRSWFRMTLYKVVEIADRFILEGWVGLSHHCRTADRLQIKTELLVMGALAMVRGTVHGFRQLHTVTQICASEHSTFFLLFVEKVASLSPEYIHLPRTPADLAHIMKKYDEVGLPGAVGSVDVVHVRWANCPAGDYNRAKGKESYPSLAFQCISDIDRKILGVFGPQFGSQNDKHIVKLDPNVREIADGWLSKVKWQYYDEDGNISVEAGVYLICDNGYFCWPTTICPYMRSESGGSRLEDLFSTNLESVRKDVECVFGILKSRWGCLDRGFKHRKMKVCGDIFRTCAVLHNMMLSEMVTEEGRPSRLRRGNQLANDGSMWLEGPACGTLDTDTVSGEAKKLKEAFDSRRTLLAHHLKVWREKNKL
jgi:hypothetical protein